mmetsp:Transcript_24244/g.45349  ORF Transcript_24244/g.45349 Transcript_24244/m.45349 type:complete len:107 (+) Transcript_24244:598-918(+)
MLVVEAAHSRQLYWWHRHHAPHAQCGMCACGNGGVNFDEACAVHAHFVPCAEDLDLHARSARSSSIVFALSHNTCHSSGRSMIPRFPGDLASSSWTSGFALAAADL